MATTTLSVRIDQEIKDQMVQLAQSTGRSTNYLINEAVQEYLARERWQITDIEQGLQELAEGDIATLEETEAVFARITTPEAMARARALVAGQE